MRATITTLTEFVRLLESGEIQDKFNDLTMHQRSGGVHVLLGGKTIRFKPQWGICALLDTVNTHYHCNGLNFDPGRAFTDYVIGLGVRSFNYPVGGISEFEGNRILWWEDEVTGSKPMWERRIALLKGFIAYLDKEEKRRRTVQQIEVLKHFVRALESGEIQALFDGGRPWGWSHKDLDTEGCQFAFNCKEGICALTTKVDEGCTHQVGLCSDLERFFEIEGLDEQYPVGGEDEYQNNVVLWWDDEDTGSKPMWRKRLALLKDFITYLEQ